MSHIVAGRFHAEHAVIRPWACVTVRTEGRRRLVVQEGSIGILKAGVLVVPLPGDIEVVGPQGERIRPSRQFYISTETFDPYHALTDGVPT